MDVGLCTVLIYIYYISWLCFALHAANANQYANQSLGKLVDVGR